MTKEDRELLLKDLCARLPYRVKIHNHLGQISTFYGIKGHFIFVPRCVRYGLSCDIVNVEDIKPYLRPMSSMTEKEEKEEPSKTAWDGSMYEYEASEYIDWLNAHHFDYRGLIEKGLALEAPDNMY